MVPILQIAKLALQRGSCLQSHSKEFDCTKLENFHSNTHVLVTHLALENMINCIFAYATKRKKRIKKNKLCINIYICIFLCTDAEWLIRLHILNIAVPWGWESHCLLSISQFPQRFVYTHLSTNNIAWTLVSVSGILPAPWAPESRGWTPQSFASVQGPLWGTWSGAPQVRGASYKAANHLLVVSLSSLWGGWSRESWIPLYRWKIVPREMKQLAQNAGDKLPPEPWVLT